MLGHVKANIPPVLSNIPIVSVFCTVSASDKLAVKDQRLAPQKRRRFGPQITPRIPFENPDDLPTASPEQHYQMPDSTQHPIELSTRLGDNEVYRDSMINSRTAY